MNSGHTCCDCPVQGSKCRPASSYPTFSVAVAKALQSSGRRTSKICPYLHGLYRAVTARADIADVHFDRMGPKPAVYSWNAMATTG